eukprot:snap_masked-scaffold_24-processed-gene-1.2-mRNA-1 protein AED:1.00 eAED:1.00 QI:0/0/0/0/1/1/3/0/84
MFPVIVPANDFCKVQGSGILKSQDFISIERCTTNVPKVNYGFVYFQMKLDTLRVAVMVPNLHDKIHICEYLQIVRPFSKDDDNR